MNVTTCLNVSHTFPHFPLTAAHGRSNYSLVAAQSATGLGSPTSTAHQRPSTDARRFFVALHRRGHEPASSMAGGTWGASAPPVRSPVCQPVPSATLLGSEVTDFHNYGVRPMATDTQAVPSERPSRQLAFIFGHIADCTEWPHDQYQALIARLIATGQPILSLTLGDVLDALTRTVAAAGQAPDSNSSGAN